MDWLRNIVNMQILTPHEYASTASKALNKSGLALIYCHFLYHSHTKKYITERIIVNLCQVLPVVDNFGKVIKLRKSLLDPADGSKWVRVIGTNPCLLGDLKIMLSCQQIIAFQEDMPEIIRLKVSS